MVDSKRNSSELLKENQRLKEEIRKLKEKNQLNQDNRDNFNTTLNSIGEAVILTENKGKITLMNPVAEKLTGWSFKEVKNKDLNKFYKIIHPGTRKEIKNPVSNLLRYGKAVKHTNLKILIDREGKEHLISDSSTPLRDSFGNMKGVVLVFRDETEEYRKREEIKASETFMKAVFTSIQDGISVLNTDLSIRYVNPVIEKWYSNSMPLVGKKCFRCYHHANKACDPCPTLRSISSGKTEVDIVPGNRDPGSEVKWIELFSYPIKESDTDEVTGVIEFARDITDRKTAEDELKLSRMRYKNLFNDSPVPLWEKDFTEVLNYLNELKKRGITDFYTYFTDNPSELDECIKKIKILDINTSTLKLFEAKSKQELLEKLDLTVTENTIETYKRKFQAFANGQHEFEAEMQIKTLKGNNRIISLKFILNFENDEKLIAILVSHDITERKISEQNLIESEKRFRLAFQTIPEPISISRISDGKYLDVNEGFIKITGYSRDEILGKTSDEINIWENPTDRIELLKKLEKTGFVKNFETTYRLKSGESRECISSATIMEMKGEPVILSMARDISEIKMAERIIQENKQRLELALKGGDLGLWDWNIKTGHVVFNERWAEILDYKLNEIEPNVKTWEKLVHPEDLPGVKKLLNDHIKGKTSFYETEHRMKTKSGNWKWILDRGKVLEWDQDGNPLRATGTHMDIDEKKKNQETAIKLSKAVEQSPESIVITDREGKIEYVNPKFSELTGFSREEALGKTPDIQKSGEHDKAYYKDMWETLLDRKTWSGEILNKKKNGSFYWEWASISPILNEKNQITHFVAVKEDITERKKMMNDLQKAKERAEESDRLKSAFLANMSHEIRTPMNGILGFAQLLKEPQLDGEKQEQYIEIIEKSGNRMLNIINDLIDISRIEAGQVELEKSRTNINKQLEYLYTFFKPEVEKKGMTFSFHTDLPYEKAIIETDKEKLYAILTNLIKNAIKYSTEGEISYGYKRKEHFLEFFVSDEGIGIPHDRLNAIFDRFVQADLSIAKKYEGSGLGLSITRAYVEMLGGTIRVDSKPGKGSVFYFTLPYDFKGSNAGNQIASESIGNIDSKLKETNILIVEDDETAKLYLGEIFKGKVRSLSYAETGLEALEKMQNNNLINLVLMDIKMPEMDGYTAATKIREFNKDIIIIAQTAYGLAGDFEKAIKAGCNDYISKPIRKQMLLGIIDKHL